MVSHYRWLERVSKGLLNLLQAYGCAAPFEVGVVDDQLVAIALPFLTRAVGAKVRKLFEECGKFVAGRCFTKCLIDEPPANVLEDISKKKKWRRGTELLGLYSGTFRTKRSHTQVKYAPDLIFVFRGPILRCSTGDLRAEVKRVVWHEVAHWLGYETEEQVKALGL